jgi:FlaA1/EpsC-like NDP-sugar epimerase
VKGGLTMNVEKTRLKRFAGITRIIIDVFFWITAVLGTVSLLFFIATFFVSEDIFTVSEIQEGWSISITGGVIRYDIDPSLYSNINFRPFLQAILPTAVVTSLMFLIIAYNLRLILKTVADDHPFEKSNSKRLLIIGIVFIAGSIISGITEGITAQAVIDTLKIKNASAVFTINVAMLLTGFLILILAGIFRYGSYLQSEYDTTV